MYYFDMQYLLILENALRKLEDTQDNFFLATLTIQRVRNGR